MDEAHAGQYMSRRPEQCCSVADAVNGAPTPATVDYQASSVSEGFAKSGFPDVQTN
jgi:hypothetical protein